ncbi:MAG: BON domain-containing protein [Chryseosolibacter sp.]
MADKNRNWQDTYRQQQDWNEDRSRQQKNYEDEPNYSINENRGYRDQNRHSDLSSGEGGWQSRYERQMTTRREGDFDNQRNYQRQGSDHNYGDVNRGISSAYSDFGGDYSSKSGSRNLYDRENMGSSRRDYENKENRIGGANYDRYGDRGRFDQGQYYGGGHGGFSYGSNYGRPGYGRSDYGEQRDYGRGRNRDYGSGDSEERSWWDRTTDEVSSWFGDEDAERRRERDRNLRGAYRGKGPRNYSRSDDRIKEDINDRLSDDPFVDASDIDVTVTNGEVTLTGTVDHRSTKRRAEDLAESVSGVKNVENRIRVSQTSGVSGMNNPSGSTSAQNSSPIPGAGSKGKENSYTNK